MEEGPLPPGTFVVGTRVTIVNPNASSTGKYTNAFNKSAVYNFSSEDSVGLTISSHGLAFNVSVGTNPSTAQVVYRLAKRGAPLVGPCKWERDGSVMQLRRDQPIHHRNLLRHKSMGQGTGKSVEQYSRNNIVTVAPGTPSIGAIHFKGGEVLRLTSDGLSYQGKPLPGGVNRGPIDNVAYTAEFVRAIAPDPVEVRSLGPFLHADLQIVEEA